MKAIFKTHLRFHVLGSDAVVETILPSPFESVFKSTNSVLHTLPFCSTQIACNFITSAIHVAWHEELTEANIHTTMDGKLVMSIKRKRLLKEAYKPELFLVGELTFFCIKPSNGVSRFWKVGQRFLKHFFIFRWQRSWDAISRSSGGSQGGIDRVCHGHETEETYMR